MLNWAQFPQRRDFDEQANTSSAHYTLTDLAERGGLARGEVNQLLIDGGLLDFGWTVTWASAAPIADAELPTLFADVDGFVLFMHGWTGTRAIWEDLPARAVTMNPRLIAFAVDHNGFGETAFVEDDPRFEVCNPAAAMAVIERWVTLLHLRREPGSRQPRVINFVGHSMGGAALFFLDESKWRLGEQTRTALAPALLLHDDLHRAFYDALGIGIGLAGRIVPAELIERRLKPKILEALTEGATPAVREEHARIYDSTAHDVIAKTLGAMGILKQHPAPHHWALMRVILGNRDRLVGLVPMLELLDELHFDVSQIRVTLGTHYLFSVNSAAAMPIAEGAAELDLAAKLARTHAQNRTLVLDDLSMLHHFALAKQRGV